MKVIQSLWKLFWVNLSYLESIDNELTKGFSSDTHQSSSYVRNITKLKPLKAYYSELVEISIHFDSPWAFLYYVICLWYHYLNVYIII